MQIKLPFDPNQPVTGEASILIDEPQSVVFAFVAENYFQHYCQWAPEIVELESYDNNRVFVGAKGRQVREDNNALVESSFEVIQYQPPVQFAIQGISTAYQATYLTESHPQPTQTTLIFRFDLLEIDLFMRPFVKLIRAAIEEGAEATVEKIKALLQTQRVASASSK